MSRTKGALNKQTIESKIKVNDSDITKKNEPPVNIPNEERIIDNEIVFKDNTENLNKIKTEFNSDKLLNENKNEHKKRASNYKSKRLKEAEFQESIKGVGSFLLKMIVERLPNPKSLQPDEIKTFDAMFTKVAFKYSTLLGAYQEEAALIGITVMIIVPRLQKTESNDAKEN